MAPRTRFDRVHEIDDRPYHLILLCKNEVGYRNLSALVSRGFTEGFYFKPRIDWELLERYHEGLIACRPAWLASCPGSFWPGTTRGPRPTP